MDYCFKIERHENKGFYVGLCALDADGQMKSCAGWRWYPWNDGTKPTEEQLAADYTALAKDSKGNDVAGSSVKHALDAQIGVAPVMVSDASDKVTVQRESKEKDEDGNAVMEDIQVAKKVAFTLDAVK